MKQFDIIDISDKVGDLTEQIGTKFKFWFRDDSSRYCLFKEGRPGTGENWAEKVASELCGLLGIPHATYELAVWQNHNGVICPNFVPEDARLVHGNELLLSKNSDYPHRQFFRVKEHSLRMVLTIMKSESVNPPLGWQKTENLKTAIDIFIGYLLLDAWIANQDRHHENWALIRTDQRVTYLAPTYDHASSLGRNESDERRRTRLKTKDRRQSVEYYVERAKSAFYSHGRNPAQLSTLEAFIIAGRQSISATQSWIEKLSSITESQTLQILSSIPRGKISDIAIEFAQKMLCLNKARLLAVIEEFE